MSFNWPKGAAILFDLDGTLIDSAPDLSGTLNEMLRRLGLAPLSLADVRAYVGKGARALLVKGLGHHEHEVSPDELDRLVADFVTHYAQRISQESRPFPGLDKVLETLKSDGVSCGVVTNKREGLARQLLDELEMTLHFGTIFGRETAASPKPHPAPIIEASNALGAQLRHTLMIGDTATDIDAAKAAGVRSVAVRFGYSPVPVDALGADAIIEHFDELLGVAANLLNRPV